jgi:hypothetical protein
MANTKSPKILADLAAAADSRAGLQLWLIKRKTALAETHFQAMSVRLHEALQRKLREVVRKRIAEAKHVDSYEYLTSDDDDDKALTLPVSASCFEQLRDLIDLGSSAPTARSPSDFMDTWAYAIATPATPTRLYAVRKMPDSMSTKRRAGLLQVLFDGEELQDGGEHVMFNLDRAIDFFGFGEQLVILSKKNFERVLNFRAGMESHRDEVLQDMEQCGLFTDVDPIRTEVGSKLSQLRRLCSIKENPLYKDGDYVAKLRMACQKHRLPIIWTGNKIDVAQSDVDLLLKLLNDDRLESLIRTGSMYDVSAKRPV